MESRHFYETDTLDETQVSRPRRITSRQDCDAIKVFETETLQRYSYQNIIATKQQPQGQSFYTK